MPDVLFPKRLHCTGCLRPETACICRWRTPVPHEVEVLILQHPLEVDNPKGSARLLHLCLPRSRLVAGEVFPPEVLTAPFDAGAAAGSPPQLLLLYPAATAAAPCTPVPAPEGARLRMVVIDGTWRKSRKMLHLNPALQHLPRLSLQGMPPSAYGIRRAHGPDQLSTLEAACYALARLECNAEKFQPVLDGFHGFVAQQRSYRPG